MPAILFVFAWERYGVFLNDFHSLPRNILGLGIFQLSDWKIESEHLKLHDYS